MSYEPMLRVTHGRDSIGDGRAVSIRTGAFEVSEVCAVRLPYGTERGRSCHGFTAIELADVLCEYIARRLEERAAEKAETP